MRGPPNPLPVLSRPMDNTALSAFMACEREYFLSMFLHRRGEGKSIPLAYGGLVHNIFDNHYKSGGVVEMVEYMARAWWEKNGVPTEGDHRTLERALLDYRKYREKWGKTPLDEIGSTVGWPDIPFVEQSFNVQGGLLWYPWAGKIDRLIELGGLYYVEDHKTTSRFDSNYYRSHELSNQMKGYTYAARLLAPNLNVVGVRINLVHILKEKTNFDRRLITYTREELDEWAHNTNMWCSEIGRQELAWPEIDDLISGEALWPKAHFGDNGCSRKFGMCQYHGLCGVAPAFRGRMLEELPINRWDPLNAGDGE